MKEILTVEQRFSFRMTKYDGKVTANLKKQNDYLYFLTVIMRERLSATVIIPGVKTTDYPLIFGTIRTGRR